MKILYILHADFETPGVIAAWATEKGYHQTYVRPFKGEKLSSHSSFDLIVSMGGPQDAVTLDTLYLKEEVNFLRDAMKAKIPVLGFCLGAQLMGAALGAPAERSPHKEIGIFPITLSQDGLNDPILSQCEDEFPVFHWHGDMPGLTKESLVLAKSEGCPRQIVRYSSTAYGFQCHPEMTQKGAMDLIKNCPNDFVAGKYIQHQSRFFHTISAQI